MTFSLVKVKVYLDVLWYLMKNWVLCYVYMSHCRVTGLRLTTPNSSKSRTNHVISEATTVIALYSASEDDLETLCCFFDFQLIGEFPKWITYLVTELLVSRQAPQS